MNYCQAGHPTHDRKTVPSIQGDFLIYDYPKYMDFAGYCMGQDDISRTIGLYGNWSQEVYDFISKILDAEKDKGLFVDVGCHIGWFSRLALSKGFTVIGFEGVTENLELAKINVAHSEFHNIWFDQKTEPISYPINSVLMKIDIEGSEQHAVRYFEESFKSGTIKNAIIEITPVFNDSYPALVERMKDWGYSVFLVDGTPWNGKFDFEQTDLWFKKV